MNLLQTTPIATARQGSLSAAGLVRFRGALHVLAVTTAKEPTNVSTDPPTTPQTHLRTQWPPSATTAQDQLEATGIANATHARLLRQEAVDGGWLEASAFDLPISGPCEARLQQTPDGDLVLLACGQALSRPASDHSTIDSANNATHQSRTRTLISSSDDARRWQRPRQLGEAGHALLHLAWQGKRPYGIATDDEGRAHWTSLGRQLRAGQSEPIHALEGQRISGAALAFDDQGRAYCLLARDNPDPAHSDALFGWADSPYQDWHWRRLGIAISEPCLTWNTDGNALYAGYRRHAQPGYWQPHWVEISELDLTGERQRRCALPPADRSGAPALLLDGQQLRCLYQTDTRTNGITALNLAEITLNSDPATVLSGTQGFHRLRLQPPSATATEGLDGMGASFAQLMVRTEEANQSPSLRLSNASLRFSNATERQTGLSDHTHKTGALTEGTRTERTKTERARKPDNRAIRGDSSTPTGTLGVLGRLRQPNCWRCQHFQITWDEAMPYGCRQYAFKSRLLPSMEVMLADGQPCLGFQAKAKAADTNTNTGWESR